MKAYSIRRYQKGDYSQWNNFVRNAKNGTFLFHRDFMEYHSDRFDDFSMLIFKGKKLVAIFPANIKDDELYSHQGLTYGGLVLEESIGGKKIQDIAYSLLEYARSKGVKTIYIKSIPIFYYQKPSNEFLFFLLNEGAEVYRRDLNLAIDYRLPLEIHKNKLKHFEKRKGIGFVIEEAHDCTEFWKSILMPRLEERHNTKPVHTIEEINKLKARFPENIKQFVIKLENKILAGITVFKTKNVAKSQYGAVTSEGEKYRALDFLFISLIEKYKDEGYQFFDMGTVTENNFGLLKQKEELGCHIYSQDFYKISL